MMCKLRRSRISIDNLVSILGVSIGTILLIIWFYQKVALLSWAASILLFSCGLYFVIQSAPWIRERGTIFMATDDLPEQTAKAIIPLAIAVAAVATLTITSVWTSGRTLFYFVGIIGISVLIIVSILLIPTKRKRAIIVVLTEILILGIIARASVYYISLGFIGSDPWFHAWATELIRLNGKIAPKSCIGWYFSFPIFHLIVSETSILLGLNIKDAMFISVSMFEIISVIPIFLVGRYIFSKRLGLLAAYLLIVSNFHIKWGFLIIPTTFGLAYLPYLIYVITRFNDSPRKRSVLLYMFLVTIILAHTLSSVVVLIVAVTLYLVTRLMNKISIPNRNGKRFPALYVMVYGISIFAYWIYNAFSFFGGYIAKAIKSLLIIDVLVMPESAVEAAIHQTSFALLFSFSILGSIFLLRKEVRSGQRLKYVLTAWTLAFLTFTALITSASALLPQRWLSYAMVLMALPAVLGMNLICVTGLKRTSQAVAKSSKMKCLRFVALVFIVILLSILMITDPQANSDGSFGSPRLSLTKSELDSVKLISEVVLDTISTDHFMSLALKYGCNYTNSYDASAIFVEGELADLPHGTIIVRSYLYVYTQTAQGAYAGYVRSPSSSLTASFNRIYDSETVVAYNSLP